MNVSSFAASWLLLSRYGVCWASHNRRLRQANAGADAINMRHSAGWLRRQYHYRFTIRLASALNVDDNIALALIRQYWLVMRHCRARRHVTLLRHRCWLRLLRV